MNFIALDDVTELFIIKQKMKIAEVGTATIIQFADFLAASTEALLVLRTNGKKRRSVLQKIKNNLKKVSQKVCRYCKKLL